jgi:hypothetical protein
MGTHVVAFRHSIRIVKCALITGGPAGVDKQNILPASLCSSFSSWLGSSVDPIITTAPGLKPTILKQACTCTFSTQGWNAKVKTDKKIHTYLLLYPQLRRTAHQPHQRKSERSPAQNLQSPIGMRSIS